MRANEKPVPLLRVIYVACWLARREPSFVMWTVDRWPVMQDRPLWEFAVAYAVIATALPFLAAWRWAAEVFEITAIRWRVGRRLW